MNAPKCKLCNDTGEQRYWEGRWRDEKAANELLRAGITAFGKALSLPGGPSLAVQRHDPSWEAWKTLCDISAGHQQIRPSDG